MSRDISSVLCPRDTSFVPTIPQLHTIADFYASRGYIDEETRGLLDAEFDRLEVYEDGRVKARHEKIIGFWAIKFPYYRPFFSFYEQRGEPAFRLAEKDEFEFYHNDEQLEHDLLANPFLAELESRLTEIFGTEIMSAVCMNGSTGMSYSREKYWPIPPLPLGTLSPHLCNMTKEEIMDMNKMRDFRGLVQVLRVPDGELRKAAILALVKSRDKIPPHLIEDELKELMLYPDPSIRKAVMEARGVILDTDAIQEIEYGLIDVDEGVRNAAKEALPKVMSLWGKVTQDELIQDNVRPWTIGEIHLDEESAISLGLEIGDIVKGEDREKKGIVKLYNKIVKNWGPDQPSDKVWRE